MVVGRGLIGSAAARHLSAAGHDVTLVGPCEPADYGDHEGPFASYFDQGRVTRISAFSEPWATWAKASIDRYPEIAEQSGISFHDPVGLVVMADHADTAASIGRSLGADIAMLTADELADRYGLASTVASHRILWEGPPAGLINPRLLVQAQNKCARLNGAAVLHDVVTSVVAGGSSVEVRCRSGVTIAARRVLACTGAYGGDLLGVGLPIERRLRTIALAEIGPGPALPTMIIDNPPHAALDEAYWVPPVMFPDGKQLLKIGGDSVPMLTARTNEDINDWFHQGGSEAEANALFELLETLLPHREIRRHAFKPCVVSYPPKGVPHISRVSETAAVAFGGCGAAAKSSDEIGRLAAETITD